MEPFTRIEGVAAPLLEDDIDTDALFPARFLLIMEKAGLGRYLLHDRRAQAASEGQAFVLDKAEYAGATILIAGANFGCGSSREQAVWTLIGAGYRVVIAPSFGEIFYANCFKNGLLPIALPPDKVVGLARLAEAGATFAVDLVAQTIVAGGQRPLPFVIAEQRRDALLNGRDDIDEILVGEARIATFEESSRRQQPWLFVQDDGAARHPLSDGSTR